MTSGAGAAKTLPQAAPSARPPPTKPRNSGSCPLPPPTSSPTLPAGRCDRTTAVAPSTSRSRPCDRSEEHTSELQSRPHLVCRLLLEEKKITPDPALGLGCLGHPVCGHGRPAGA